MSSYRLDRRAVLRGAATVGPALALGRPLFGKPADPPEMLVHQRVPHNAEPPLPELVHDWVTPTEWFYVRSHAPVPEIDPGAFRLVVDGMVERPLSLSLRELREGFVQTAVTATMTCAGNRRNEHSLTKQVKGVPWQSGAIGNAQWVGVPLRAVLEKAGIKASAKHVWFEGLDQVERPNGTIPFGASIPMEKVMAGAAGGEPLLVWGMNGEPLTPDHGFPLRTVVPGFIGARSVKWVGRVTVSDRPSPNHYVATAYKTVAEDTPDAWGAESPIQTNVVNSVTCYLGMSSSVTGDRRFVEAVGYALPSGLPGAKVTKVEVSIDGGETWAEARIKNPAREFCWALWRKSIRVQHATGKWELLVRATDSTGATQPQTVPWNLKGYLFNAWHQSRLEVPARGGYGGEFGGRS